MNLDIGKNVTIFLNTKLQNIEIIITVLITETKKWHICTKYLICDLVCFLYCSYKNFKENQNKKETQPIQKNVV